MIFIRDHRLFINGQVVPLTTTPNVSAGRLAPQYLVLHYTAGPSMASAVSWFSEPRSRASAHLVIGRSGAVAQLAPFDRITWHAGQSRWRGLTGLNRYAIGIEMENAGVLERKGGSWCAWFGDRYADDEVMEDAVRARAWHVYTPEQIERATAIAAALVEHYGLIDVIGHADIAPGRKLDPGPAFPLASVRSQALGCVSDAFDIHETTTRVNIRVGPGLSHPRLPESPLPYATRLHVLETSGRWCFVEVLDGIGESHVSGWVHGDYVRAQGCPV